MRFVHILSLMITILFMLPGPVIGAVTDEHTIDEWRSILAVDDKQGRLTGLQLSLAIEPDRYYLPVGTLINLSGELSNVFGPLNNAGVMLAIGYDEMPQQNTTLITNENGEFSTSVIVNRTGIIRYQVWFEGTDLRDTNQTKSPEIEIKGVFNDSPSGERSESLIPPDKGNNEYSLQVNSPDSQYDLGNEEELDNEGEEISEGDGSLANQTDGAVITLSTSTDSFLPGQNVTFSGVLTGPANTPLAHRIVLLEMAYDIDDFQKVGDSLVTNRDGQYNVSYHLTGPDCPIFRAVSTDEQGYDIMSEPVTLKFIPDEYEPLAKIRYEARHIEADLAPSIIQTGENITVSGWFADANGDAISRERLNLYWYNFADQIWDRYEPGADVLTAKDGNYVINVSGPDLTGITYVAMVSKYEISRKPLFSRALPLTVRNETETIPSVLPVFLDGFSVPDEVRVMEPAMITFQLSDPTGIPLPYEPIQVFFSEDGFTWFMNGNGNLTTGPDGTFTFNDTPKQSGFHYYRGVYNGTELYGPADSGIIVLAITGNETEPLGSG